jgi:hypothetical protein
MNLKLIDHFRIHRRRIDLDRKIDSQVVEHLPRQGDETGAIILSLTVGVEPEGSRFLISGGIASGQYVEDLGSGRVSRFSWPATDSTSDVRVDPVAGFRP